MVKLVPAQTDLPLFDEHECAETVQQRSVLITRWLHLTRHVLPSMAKYHSWTISLDHCFMRVCLDTSLGAPWHMHVKRPAIKYMTTNQLTTAIAMAEAIIASPETLDALNRQSIRWRGK